MSFLANIGVQWAGYNVYGVLANGSLNPTPVGIVDCEGDLVIPDDPSLGAGFVTGEVCSNFADANGFFNSDAGYTMTSPALYFNATPALAFVGQAIPTGNQANNFLWINNSGNLVAPFQLPFSPFWPSINWAPLGTIPDLSENCDSNLCDPDDLVNHARCFKCIPKGMQREVQIYLLCQIANL